MKSERKYVIRFFSEKDNKAYYVSAFKNKYKKDAPIEYRFGNTNGANPTIFDDYETANENLLAATKYLKKLNRKHKGYLYLSKVFVTEGDRGRINFKLTKPDKNDFLSAL